MNQTSNRRNVQKNKRIKMKPGINLFAAGIFLVSAAVAEVHCLHVEQLHSDGQLRLGSASRRRWRVRQRAEQLRRLFQQHVPRTELIFFHT